MRISKFQIVLMTSLCFIVIVYMGFDLSRSVYMAFISSSWSTTEGKVVEVVSQSKLAELRYEYFIDGRRYVGDKFSFLSTSSIGDKLIITQTYHVGDRIKVFVDPKNLSRSVVVRRPISMEYVWPYLYVVAFCLVAVLILQIQMIGVKTKEAQRTIWDEKKGPN